MPALDCIVRGTDLNLIRYRMDPEIVCKWYKNFFQCIFTFFLSPPHQFFPQRTSISCPSLLFSPSPLSPGGNSLLLLNYLFLGSIWSASKLHRAMTEAVAHRSKEKKGSSLGGKTGSSWVMHLRCSSSQRRKSHWHLSFRNWDIAFQPVWSWWALLINQFNQRIPGWERLLGRVWILMHSWALTKQCASFQNF